MDLHVFRSWSTRAFTQATALLLATAAGTALASNPLVSVLEDFEAGSTAGVVPATAANSASTGATNSSFANVSDAGSRRLQMTDSDGTYNGGLITFPGAITAPGYYLITADIKVDNASASIGTFGMGVVAGPPTTTKISDVNAGYIPNLAGTGDAALGYQTIGAAVNVPAGGTFPRDLTVYFGTDISGNDYNASAYDGNYNGTHRGGLATWASGSTNAVYVDNIKKTGPGNFGEERHLWISLGDGYTDLAKLENLLVSAKNNNINCVDLLVRYRADAYYVPNRTNATYPNPEPFGTKVGNKAASATNDPLQYAIDRGHELGLKVYAAFSTFLVTDGASGIYPSFLPSGSQMWYYNSGSPRVMTGSDPSSEGIWADLSRADVRTYTKNVFMDMVTNYDVDGVIFDRVRYPTNTYSYNPQGLSEMGIAGTPSPTDAAFREARRTATTDFLQECYEEAIAAKPWLVVGTVPIAFADSLNDTYNNVFQSWPKWTGRKTNSRATSFGVCDIFQPQFYRLWNSTSPYEAPGSNTRLMNKAQFGDVAANALDLGLMPGAAAALAPLFYHPSSGDANQSNANAQNITDGRALSMTGFGLYPGTTSINDMSLIRNPGASTAGVDVLATAAPFNDYFFKKNYDNIAPNAVTNFTASAQADGTVNLNWTAPVAASDGEQASRYLVYRSTSAGVKKYWSNLVTKSPIAGSATSFTVPVDFAGTYYYKIVPVDDYNNHGPATETGPVAAVGEPLPPADIIVDNPQAVLTGTWSLATGAADKYGADYRYKGVGTGAANVRFNASLPADGSWSVYEWHNQGSNRASNARHTVTHSGGSSLVLVNQTINGGKWNKLGDYSFAAGTSAVTVDDSFTGTVVIADAMRWSYIVQSPAAPSGVTATASGQTQINLSWTDNSTNERNTIVARSTTSGGPYTDIATLGVNTTSYSDSGLNANTTYYYVVRTVNSAGASANSPQGAGTTLPFPPAAPGSLATSTVSQTQINLSWTDNSANETNFVVARSTTSGGPYTDIATLGANVTSYNNTGLSAATQYYYVVRATNSGGASGNSNQASATTLPNPPAAPGALAATEVSTSQINLTWSDNSSNETNFIVARSATSGGPFTDIATLGANVTSYSNTGLTASTTYYYVVRATNSGGDSVNSAQASATTQAGGAIVDNTTAVVTGSNWSIGTGASDKYGTDYRWKGQGTGSEYLTYTPNLATAGLYEVYEWHPAGTNRTAGAPHQIAFNGGSDTVLVNQQGNGGTWNLLGQFNFAAGTGGNVRITDGFADAGQVVLADAVKFVYVGAAAAPSGPTGLATSVISSAQIDLSWNDVLNENGYTVARSTTAGGPYYDMGSVGPGVTNYSATGLTAGTTHYFVVRATNSAGSSPDSNEASGTTPLTAPAVPTDLAATAVSKSQINLTWTDNSWVETNYVVGRSTTAGGPYTDIATLGANVTTYSNTGLAGNTRYYYVVRSVNSSGTYGNGNEANALTWPADVIVDNSNSGFTASSNWSTATSAADKYGTNYRYRSTAGTNDAATWNYSVPQSRSYQVYAWWTQGTNRSKTAPYIVYRSGGSTTVKKNQQSNGGSWQSLGTFTLNSGANKVALSCWTTKGYVVVADAVKIVAR